MNFARGMPPRQKSAQSILRPEAARPTSELPPVLTSHFPFAFPGLAQMAKSRFFAIGGRSYKRAAVIGTTVGLGILLGEAPKDRGIRHVQLGEDRFRKPHQRLGIPPEKDRAKRPYLLEKASCHSALEGARKLCHSRGDNLLTLEVSLYPSHWRAAP